MSPRSRACVLALLVMVVVRSAAAADAPTITARWADAKHAIITISQPGCLSNQRVWIGCAATAGEIVLPPKGGPHDAAVEPFAGAVYCLTAESGAVVCDALRSVVGLPWLGR